MLSKLEIVRIKIRIPRQAVGWGPDINSSYLRKAYSKMRFSNVWCVSTLVDRDQSVLPAVALQHSPSSLHTDCWPLLSPHGWQMRGLSLKPFWNHLLITVPTLVQRNNAFSLLPKISPVAMQKSSSGSESLWTLIFPPEKENKQQK